ncbi:MAG: GTP pyrophosphokinase family protein [Solirubrobacteraceae bacterium]
MEHPEITAATRRPAGDRRAIHAEHARRARERYERSSYQAFLRRLGETLAPHLERLIAGTGIPDTQFEVTWRIKGPASFEAKAARPDPDEPDRPKYRLPCDELADQLGLRVVTFLPAQVEEVAEALADDDALTVRSVVRMGSDGAHDRQFGYQSTHVLVDPGRPLSVPRPPQDYVVPRVEIQLRTQLQHVWAELEHAQRYKGAAGSRVSRKFDRAAALIEMVDELLQEIDDASRGADRGPGSSAVAFGRADADDPVARHARDDAGGRLAPAAGETEERPGSRLTARALRALLAELFPDAPPSRGTGSEEWIHRHALAVGLDTVEALRDAVRGVDIAGIERTFREGVTWERNQVRSLDDALLAVTGPRYVDVAEGLVDPADDAQRQKRRRVLLWRWRTLADAGVVRG